MTQQNPSVLLYGQAIILLQQLIDAYNTGVINTVDDLSVQLNQVLAQYQDSVGSPLTEYEPVADTEPPLAGKMNRFWNGVMSDISLLQHQVDIARASAVLTHTLITTEIQKALNQNATVNNKLKTLQLYSSAVDTSIITFGDHFNNSEFMDNSLVTPSQQVGLVANNFITLGQLGDLVNLTENATVRALDSSNGFPGNNQEVEDPAQAPVDPTTNTPVLTFIAESTPARDLKAVLDANPLTWFEYEYYKVTDRDRQAAQNFGFTYQVATDSGDVQFVDWAKGPAGDLLKLDLEFNLGGVQKINQVSYTPYGLRDNANFPVKVTRIQVSSDGTQWTVIDPQNVWIGTQPNLQTLRSADTVVLNQATWSFQDQSAQYVRVSFEQPTPVNVNVGHIFYVDKKTNRRADGSIPTLARIEDQYEPNVQTQGDLIQRRESFSGQRWAIGVRDLIVQQIKYQTVSTMVTTPIESGGLVDRVTVDADVYVPPDWDQSVSYVSFFVTPDDGVSWYQINRVRDDFLGIPEEIAFNDPLPDAFRESGVSYVKTTDPVTRLRLKIILTRPDDAESATPLVRSYQLRVKKR